MIVFVAIVAMAGLGGCLVGNEQAQSVHVGLTDNELLRLFRFMAVIKAGLAGLVVTLIGWRLLQPIGQWYAALYVSAAAAMAAAPGMIWNGVDIVLAALLFHAGLLAILLAGWVDRELPHPMAAHAIGSRGHVARWQRLWYGLKHRRGGRA